MHSLYLHTYHPGLDSYSVKATASYLYEGLEELLLAFKEETTLFIQFSSFKEILFYLNLKTESKFCASWKAKRWTCEEAEWYSGLRMQASCNIGESRNPAILTKQQLYGMNKFLQFLLFAREIRKMWNCYCFFFCK